MRPIAIAAVGGLIVTTGWAVEVTKVWDVTNSSTPKDLPIRVEKASAREIWVLDDKPSMLTIVAPGDGVVETKTFASQEPVSGYHEHFWFSKNGELALFLPSGETGSAHVRKFDLSRRQFEADALPVGNVSGFAMGPSQVAVLVEEGATDRFDPPKKLMVHLVSHDGKSLHSKRLWEEDEFTKFVSVSLSDDGTLTAIAARVGRAPQGLGLAWHDFTLIVQQGNDIRKQKVEGLGSESVVTVSEDGKWIAIAIHEHIHVYETERLTLVTTIAIDGCSAHENAQVRKLSIGADQSIGAVLLGRGGWEVVMVTATECKRVAAYRFEDVAEINLQVLPQRRVYVAPAGRLSPTSGGIEIFMLK